MEKIIEFKVGDTYKAKPSYLTYTVKIHILAIAEYHIMYKFYNKKCKTWVYNCASDIMLTFYITRIQTKA